jgi:hypothetical protein
MEPANCLSVYRVIKRMDRPREYLGVASMPFSIETAGIYEGRVNQSGGKILEYLIFFETCDIHTGSF